MTILLQPNKGTECRNITKVVLENLTFPQVTLIPVKKHVAITPIGIDAGSLSLVNAEITNGVLTISGGNPRWFPQNPKASQAPGSGGKYNISITGIVQGQVIGDQQEITQHFHGNDFTQTVKGRQQEQNYSSSMELCIGIPIGTALEINNLSSNITYGDIKGAVKIIEKYIGWGTFEQVGNVDIGLNFGKGEVTFSRLNGDLTIVNGEQAGLEITVMDGDIRMVAIAHNGSGDITVVVSPQTSNITVGEHATGQIFQREAAQQAQIIGNAKLVKIGKSRK